MPRTPLQREALGYAALALASCAAYAICLGHRFVNWDDPFLLEGNAPLLRFELLPGSPHDTPWYWGTHRHR